MRSLKSVLGAGVAAAAIVGLCGAALAQSPQYHVMNLTLPDGGVAHIRYVGNTPPRVAISDAPVPIFAAMPSFFGPDSPFAEMQRISAAMDRQADQMFREVAAMQSGAAAPNLITVSEMPAGSRAYSFVSAMNGSNVCSRSMVITSEGNGAAPHVVTHTSGNCSAVAAPGVPTPTQLPTAPASTNGPRMIMTKAIGARPYTGRIEEASLN